MAAISVFSAYLGEIEASVSFVRYSAQLRPRLGPYIRWESAGPEERDLFKSFLAGDPNERKVYQSALVSVCAGLEQFLSDLLDDVCDCINARKLSGVDVERMFPGALDKQRKYAGHPLDRLHEPRGYWRIGYDDLISSLATTRRDSAEVRFYGRSVAVNIGGVDLPAITQAFERLSITVPWVDVCKSSVLQRALGTAAQAETRAALENALTKMVVTRNSLAHSQGSEVVEYVEIVKYIDVARELSNELSEKLLRLVAASK